MGRRFFSAGALTAWLALNGISASAEDAAARTPLAKPGDTYVSLQVEGCADQCPSFEIYVFSSGRMTFRSNNQYTSAKGKQFKSGMPAVYAQIRKYLDESGTFTQSSECTQQSSEASVATAQSAHDSQLEKASWSSACPEQREKGRAVVKVFVNQTGMWRLINSDTRYWEKYWETWEDVGATR
jgi:hypothetical protein